MALSGEGSWLEHGTITHENVHVPLIFRFPGDAITQPRAVSRTVSLVDVFPTLLARLNLDSSAEFYSQAAGMDALNPAFDRPFALSQRSVRPTRWGAELRFALSSDRYRWYHVPGGAEELYDIQTDPGELIDIVFEQVGSAVKEGGRFSYPNFGTFTVKERKAREGRNPRTKEPIQIPASKTVNFKPAPTLKDSL